MKNLFLKFFLIVFFLICNRLNSFAQEENQSEEPRMSFNGGLAIPLGKFENIIGGDAGKAQDGYMFGTDINFPSRRKTKLLFTLLYAKNEYFTNSDSQFATAWKSLSPLVGFRFKMNKVEQTTLYWSLQLGGTFLTSPDIIDLNTFPIKKIKADSEFYFTGSLSVGIIVNNVININSRYLGNKKSQLLLFSAGIVF